MLLAHTQTPPLHTHTSHSSVTVPPWWCRCARRLPPQIEALYVDPYSNPRYDIQANKIRAKAEREAARARAAKDKAEK